MSQFTHDDALVIGFGDAIGLAAGWQDPERRAYPPTQAHTLAGEHTTRAASLAALDQFATQTDAALGRNR